MTSHDFEPKGSTLGSLFHCACMTKVTINNDCLVSGNEIILRIDSDRLPAGVAVADG